MQAIRLQATITLSIEKLRAKFHLRKKLVNWLLTDEGQQAIANAGYIPAANKEVHMFENQVQKIELYQALGTGYEKPENYKKPSHNYRVTDIIFQKPIDEKPGYTYEFKGLKNKELENEINSFIGASIGELIKYEQDLIDYVARKKFCYVGSNSLYTENNIVNVDATCVNGYLSVVVYLAYTGGGQDGTTYYYDCRTAVYDIYNGKKLELSDLFYKDADFADALNQGIRKDAMISYDPLVGPYDITNFFIGVAADFKNFTAESLIYSVKDKNNLFFGDGVILFYRDLEGLSCVEQPRDMQGFWESNVEILHCLNDKRSTYGISKKNTAVFFLKMLKTTLTVKR